MPYKDPEKRKQYLRDYHKHKRQTDPEFRRKARERSRKWCRANPEKRRATEKRSRRKLKQKVMTAYGGDPPECACCGEGHMEFLEIDHINNNGKEQRAKIGYADAFYRWLRKNNYPDNLGLRVLCSNCNDSYGRYGYCPHTTEGEYG